mgnify:FL=1
MNKKRLLQRVLINQNYIKFEEFVVLVESFGFTLDRINGSHHIFKHPFLKTLINLQIVNNEAKPYQVRQFLKIIEKHNLKMRD